MKKNYQENSIFLVQLGGQAKRHVYVPKSPERTDKCGKISTSFLNLYTVVGTTGINWREYFWTFQLLKIFLNICQRISILLCGRIFKP